MKSYRINEQRVPTHEHVFDLGLILVLGYE